MHERDPTLRYSLWKRLARNVVEVARHESFQAIARTIASWVAPLHGGPPLYHGGFGPHSHSHGEQLASFAKKKIDEHEVEIDLVTGEFSMIAKNIELRRKEQQADIDLQRQHLSNYEDHIARLKKNWQICKP